MLQNGCHSRPVRTDFTEPQGQPSPPLHHSVLTSLRPLRPSAQRPCPLHLTVSLKAHCLVDPSAAAGLPGAALLIWTRLWPAHPLHCTCSQLHCRWELTLSLSACAVPATSQLAFACQCLLQGCDKICRPSAADESAVMAHELLQVADERALVLVGPPQTGALTERACRAAMHEDISEADRARELEQIAVKAMRAYCQ